MPVVFTAAALGDLRRIRDFIGQDNPVAAKRVAARIIAACDRLNDLAERGRPGLVPGTRELAIIRHYVIVYQVRPDRVSILRVWHGAQRRPGA